MAIGNRVRGFFENVMYRAVSHTNDTSWCPELNFKITALKVVGNLWRRGVKVSMGKCIVFESDSENRKYKMVAKRVSNSNSYVIIKYIHTFKMHPRT